MLKLINSITLVSIKKQKVKQKPTRWQEPDCLMARLRIERYFFSRESTILKYTVIENFKKHEIFCLNHLGVDATKVSRQQLTEAFIVDAFCKTVYEDAEKYNEYTRAAKAFLVDRAKYFNMN